MEGSRLIARNLALNLSDVALAIAETLPLLSKRNTRQKALDRLVLLRKRISELTSEPGASRSLRAYSVMDFDEEEFYSVLDRLRSESDPQKLGDLRLEVEGLVSKTWDNLHEVGRATRGYASSV